MWIYEAPDWLALRWDAAALAGPCAAVLRQQERLRAHMQACSQAVQARFRLALLTEEITASAAIEGEHFDKHCVRACLEERLPWLAAAGQEQTTAHATLQSSLSATGSRPVGADGAGRSGRVGRADRKKPCQGMVDMVCEALLLPQEPFPDAAPARACARCTGTEPAQAPTPMPAPMPAPMLTTARLCSWQAALFAGRRHVRILTGALRTPANGPMRVVSGPAGRERVHFEAPAAERLAPELAHFCAWMQGEEKPGTPAPVRRALLAPVLAAGLAHLWFVVLHPFEDGNGRISRALAGRVLAEGAMAGSGLDGDHSVRSDRMCGAAPEYACLSAQILREQADYYAMLEKTDRGNLDVTPWLCWFAGCSRRALIQAGCALGKLQSRLRVWQRARACGMTARQSRVLERLAGDSRGTSDRTSQAS